MTTLPAREALGTPMGPRIPVLKRTQLGQTFTGSIVSMEWRAQRKKDAAGVIVDVINPATQKPRQELVLTLLTISSTMPCGIGDEPATIPAPGTLVREIIKGREASAWIEAQKTIQGGAARFDIYTVTATRAVTYDAHGTVKAELTTNEQIAAVPRGVSLGVYGDITVRMYGPADAPWVTLAQQAHMAASREPLAAAAPAAPAYDSATDGPF